LVKLVFVIKENYPYRQNPIKKVKASTIVLPHCRT